MFALLPPPPCPEKAGVFVQAFQVSFKSTGLIKSFLFSFLHPPAARIDRVCPRAGSVLAVFAHFCKQITVDANSVETALRPGNRGRGGSQLLPLLLRVCCLEDFH